MATDKSLRQHYDNGKIVDPFRKGFETIAGKAADVKDTLTSGLVARSPDEDPNTFDLGTKVQDMAKQQIKSRIQNAVLSKLGLSFLNPFLGIASLFGFDPFSMAMSQAKKHGIMQGFAPDSTSFLNPFGTQEAWEANQAAEALGRRKDYMWNRMLEDKPYSEKNLINVINKIAKKEGYHDAMDMEMNLTKRHIPEAPEVKSPFAKVVPKTPEVITPHGPDETAPDVTKDFGFEDAKAAAQQAAAQQAAAKQAAAKQAAKQAVDRHRGNGGGGGGGGAPGSPGGEGGWKGAKGGYVDRPLLGRNRYL